MSLNLPEADPADIIVIVSGGLVDQVKAPAGLSIQVRTYDKRDSGELCKDEDERPCRVNWLKEPGEANHEDTPAICPVCIGGAATWASCDRPECPVKTALMNAAQFGLLPTPSPENTFIARGKPTVWSEGARRMLELKIAQDLLTPAPGPKFSAFPVTPPARWCAIEIDGEMMGWMGIDTDPHFGKTFWALHLKAQRPKWLADVRAAGPYVTMLAAQYAIQLAYTAHKAQGRLPSVGEA